MFTEVKAATVGPITKIISSIMLSTENAVIKTGPDINIAAQRARISAPIDGEKKPLIAAKIKIQIADKFDGMVKISALAARVTIKICQGSIRCWPNRSVNLEVIGPPIAAATAPDAETAPAKV